MAGTATLIIGRIATDHTAMISGAITAARFMGLMAMGVFIPIIMVAGFHRRLLHLHRRLLSLRDSEADDDSG